MLVSHNMPLHWDILDTKRTALLPLLKVLAERGFYLAGGTGLALQLGYRDSIDFDFFIETEFDTTALRNLLESIFSSHTITFTQQEKDTLSCLVDDSIQLSFLGYPYPLVAPLVHTEYFPIASIKDIGCMKLSAIIGRSVEKDYVDLYTILKHISLSELLSLGKQKHASLDEALILKSLVYFDDILREQILYKEGYEVPFTEVQEFLRETVMNYFKKS